MELVETNIKHWNRRVIEKWTGVRMCLKIQEKEEVGWEVRGSESSSYLKHNLLG